MSNAVVDGLDCSSDNYYLLVRNILNGTQTSNHYKKYEDLKLLYYLVSRPKEAFQGSPTVNRDFEIYDCKPQRRYHSNKIILHTKQSRRE